MRQLVSLVVLAVASSLNAQAPRQASMSPMFTAEDALDVTTFQVADLSADGRWLAATSSVRRDGFGVDFRRDGDPTYVRPSAVRLWVVDTRTGERRAVYAEKRNVRSARWSPDGSQLAFLQSSGADLEPVVWNRASGKTTTLKVPAGKYVAENSDLRWTADGSRLIYSLRTPQWRTEATAMFQNLTAGPVLVMSSKDPFLSWEALRRMSAQQSVVSHDVKSGQTSLLAEGRVSNFDVSEDASTIVVSEDITRKTDYDVIFGSENQLVARRLDCGAQQGDCAKGRTILPSLKQTTITWARDGKRFAYSKDGRVFTGSIADTATKQIAGAPTSEKVDAADTTKATRDRRAKQRFSAVRYSPPGDAVLISNNEGLWLHDVAAGTRELIVATSDSNPDVPRVQFSTWSDDGRKLLFTGSSRTKWQRGVLRFDRDRKKLDTLVMDGRSYSGIRLSKDGGTVVFNVAAGNRPADVHAANGSFRNERELLQSNPQLGAKRLGKTELLAYLDADGHRKHAVLHFPSDYAPGKAYPTVFIIYEDFFDDTFDVMANILNAHGYLVVKPSVDFDIGFPGEAWLKGVTSAANKLIEMGVADSTRLGVQGGSYGGYATNLLITQTNRFRAAINISGKVDIISFYTDSPRLGVRNIHAAEKSQDRLGATLWQQPQKYVAHSAIMYADRIRTPLMLITGQLDSNVPADNTREMYYALRRLDKEVVWVNYMNGGHGGGNDTAANWLDMNRRIVEWYDAKLKRPADKTATN